MDNGVTDGDSDDYDALEEASEARLESLYTRPELRALIAEIQRDLEPEEATRLDNEARRQQVSAPVMRLPAQRVAVETAKVVVDRATRPLEEIARDAGLEVSDFKKLHVGSPRARTVVALRVLEQIDAIYHRADKTLGGTARLPRPAAAAIHQNAAGVKIGLLDASPASARNVTGTQRLEVPGALRTRTTGTEVMPWPDEVSERRPPPPRSIPGPFWLAAVVAILVAVVLLAVFR